MISTVARRGVQRRKKPRVLVAAVVALALAYAQPARAQEVTEPSAIEHALVEYLCRTAQRPAMIGTDAYQSCYSSKLATLREPFGRDLASLTAADRKSIDAKCGDFQATRGRDAYLACLYEQLDSIRDRRGLTMPVEASLVAPQAAEPTLPLALPAAVAQPTSPVWWWIAGTLAVAGGAGGAAIVVLKRRTVTRSYMCRGCGTELPAAGDLCANCRHAAADARRRAIAEQGEEERLQEEQRRRDAEMREEDHRHQLARQEETTEFDPYVVLGLDRTASAERLQSAYEEAKARYDATKFEHLGRELQDHFAAKAEAVERAYSMLAASE